MFLAIASRSYAMRDWTKRELDAFVRGADDLHRLFAVECLPLDEGEVYPTPLQDHKRVEFWHVNAPHSQTAMPLSPALDPLQFHRRIHDVADQIRSQGSACIHIHARNMIARLRPDDQVFIRKWEFAQVAVGDVIAYERGSRLYIQRVLRRTLMRTENGRSSFLVTRDDANVNSLVAAQEFLGRATRIHRRNRHIDLESMGQVLIGRIIAIVSRWRRVARSPLRIARNSALSTNDRAHS